MPRAKPDRPPVPAQQHELLRRIALLGHGLRAPLHLILGYTRLIQGDPDRPAYPPDDERLAIVARSGMQMHAAIEALMDLCTTDARPEPQPGVSAGALVPEGAAQAGLRAAPAGRRHRALVVDDDANTRKLLCIMCRHWGLQVQQAPTGALALALCRRCAEPFDLVLVDQHMPEMTGWEFLQTLRADARLARLPVILVSGDAQQPPDTPAGLAFDAVLAKPFGQANLARVLQQVLGIPAPCGPTMVPHERPPDKKLGGFRQALALGDVLAIQRWAHDLAVAQPRFGRFAAEVESACRRVDLPTLALLAAPR